MTDPDKTFVPSADLLFWQKDEKHLAIVGTPSGLSAAGFAPMKKGERMLSQHAGGAVLLVLCHQDPAWRMNGLKDGLSNRSWEV